MTQENYVDMRTIVSGGSKYGSPQSWGSCIHIMAFYAFFVVGVLFLVSLILGLSFEAYTEHTKKHVKSERLKEYQGLSKAFAELDKKGTGQLSHRLWRGLLLHLRPDCSQLESQLLYRMISDRKGKLDAIDFLNLRSVLKLKFMPPQLNVKSELNFLWEKVHLKCEHLMGLRSMNIVRNALLCADVIMICWDAEYSRLTPRWPVNDTLMTMALSATLLVEVGAKSGVKRFWSSSSWATRLEVLCICASVLQLLPVTEYVFNGMSRVSAIRVLRLFRYSTNLRRYGESFLQVLPILAETVSFCLVVTFLFSAIGVEVFYADERFTTAGAAFSTMIQLLFGVDFNDTISGVAEKGTTMYHTVAVEVFFILYFVIAVMLVMNLVSALMIEFYNCSLTDRTEDADSDIESKLKEVAESAPTLGGTDAALAAWVVDALGTSGTSGTSEKKRWRSLLQKKKY